VSVRHGVYRPRCCFPRRLFPASGSRWPRRGWAPSCASSAVRWEGRPRVPTPWRWSTRSRRTPQDATTGIRRGARRRAQVVPGGDLGASEGDPLRGRPRGPADGEPPRSPAVRERAPHPL